MMAGGIHRMMNLTHRYARQVQSLSIKNVSSAKTMNRRSCSSLSTRATSNVSHPLLISRSCNHRSFSSAPSLTQLIKELRASTGAPMMECKKALTAEGVDMDLTKASEWLRTNSSSKISNKVSNRDASEGMVGVTISLDGSKASVVKVSSETDFASRSEAFSDLIKGVAHATVESVNVEGDVDVDGALLDAAVGNDSGLTVKKALEDAVLSIRENVQIKSATVLHASTPNSIFSGYVHNRSPHSVDVGTVAAVVELTPTNDKSDTKDTQEIGKKLAMHVVASRPTYLSPDSVPVDVLEREKEILREQIAASGKKSAKPEIIDKIVSGRMNKFYEETCLTEQPHMVEEGNPKISKFLKKLGLQVTRFQIASVV